MFLYKKFINLHFLLQEFRTPNESNNVRPPPDTDRQQRPPSRNQIHWPNTIAEIPLPVNLVINFYPAPPNSQQPPHPRPPQPPNNN